MQGPGGSYVEYSHSVYRRTSTSLSGSVAISKGLLLDKLRRWDCRFYVCANGLMFSVTTELLLWKQLMPNE